MVKRRWTALGAAVIAALALLTVGPPTASAAEPTLGFDESCIVMQDVEGNEFCLG